MISTASFNIAFDAILLAPTADDGGSLAPAEEALLCVAAGRGQKVRES